MSKPIIEVNNISKCYTIGMKETYGSLREEIMQAISSPFKRIFKKHGENKVKSNDDSDVFWALKDVSFNVGEGEVLGIIGKNGSGKSTMLKILSRITEPTSGRIIMRGRVASLLEVGTGFHPELTGRENIFLNGSLLGMGSKEIKTKFDEIVAFSEIEKFLDTPVKRYSSGMYVRLAFAVAAHLQPEILIIDEVLAVGDVEFQKKCVGKMSDAAKSGRTVLFVSHNILMVQRLCTKAILLEAGTIKEIGYTDAVIESYLTTKQENNHQENLYDLPRDGTFGQKVRITSCRLYDSKGKETDSLKFGELFSVEVECIAQEYLRRLQFAIGINSSFDQRITTLVGPDSEKSFNLRVGEKKKGIVRLNNLYLNPGRYSLTLGIRDHTIGYDHLINVFYFNIESARHESLISEEIIQYGLIYVSRSEWIFT